MSNASCVYKVDPDVISEKLGEEVVLVHLETGRIHHTNETGSRIWELLQEGRSLREMVEILRVEYSTSSEAIASDIREFIKSLRRENMIEMASETE